MATLTHFMTIKTELFTPDHHINQLQQSSITLIHEQYVCNCNFPKRKQPDEKCQLKFDRQVDVTSCSGAVVRYYVQIKFEEHFYTNLG